MLKYCSERETDGAVHKKKKKKNQAGSPEEWYRLKTVELLNTNGADSPDSSGSPTLSALKFSQLREVILQLMHPSAYTTLLKVGITTDCLPSGVN